MVSRVFKGMDSSDLMDSIIQSLRSNGFNLLDTTIQHTIPMQSFKLKKKPQIPINSVLLNPGNEERERVKRDWIRIHF